MLEFDLPSLPGSTNVGDAFAPLLRRGVSGLVVVSGSETRLLHYTDLLNAWQNKVTSLAEVPGGHRLRDPGATLTRSVDDFHVLSVGPDIARVLSRMERMAEMYLAHAAGYCCSGPDQHCYPPYTRGSDDRCVVFPCTGRLP
jgi:hypothetical protein